MERTIHSKLQLDDVCGKQPSDFKKDRSFQDHVRTHAEEKFQCIECPSEWTEGPENIFNTLKQLITHMHQYHKDNRNCIKCPKSFSAASNRIKHEATHHGTIYECQTCDKLYENKNSYKTVSYTHLTLPTKA